jgi:hypothetical protein
MSRSREGLKKVLRKVLSVGLMAMATGLWTSLVHGGIVGSITVQQPTRILTGTVGGEVVDASQSVNLAGTCLAGDTVHWIQMVTSITTAPGPGGLGVPTFSPNTQFIDPINGQNIGGGQTGNNTPFYDITVNGNVGNFGNPANWLRDGTGTLFQDAPRLPFATIAAKSTFPFTVTFQTLLVATSAAAPNQLLMLGGFQWGFTLTNMPNNVTLNPTTGLTFATINPNWNAVLGRDFAGNTLAMATCPEGNPVVSFSLVPEPSTIVMGLLAIPGMIVVTARYRRRRAA